MGTYISSSEDDISDYDPNENMIFDDVVYDMQNISSTQVEHAGKKNIPLCPEYRFLGFPSKTCKYYGATMWNEERVNKNNMKEEPVFSICCAKGKIKLEKNPPTLDYLHRVYFDKEKGPTFRKSQ